MSPPVVLGLDDDDRTRYEDDVVNLSDGPLFEGNMCHVWSWRTFSQ